MSRTDATSLVPALFLHIRKTAGTSIVWEAIKHYGREKVASHGDYMGKPPGCFKDIPFVSGHFGHQYASHLAAGRFRFTFLRNPRERIVSLYSFCRTRDPNEYPIYRLAKQHDLDGFLKAAWSDDLIYSYIFNSQVWCLASGPGESEIAPRTTAWVDLYEQAITNVEEYDHVGLLETFDQDARTIFDSLHFQVEGFVLATNVTPAKIRISDLPKSTIDLLDELTEWDSMLYNVILLRKKGAFEEG